MRCLPLRRSVPSSGIAEWQGAVDDNHRSRSGDCLASCRSIWPRGPDTGPPDHGLRALFRSAVELRPMRQTAKIALAHYTYYPSLARARARAATRAAGGPYAWRREKSEWLIRRPEGLDAGAAGRVEQGPADAAGLGRAHVRVREGQAEKRASGAVAGAAARGWRRRRSGSRLEAGLGSGHSLAEGAPHPGDRANRIAVGPCSHDWGKGYRGRRPALVGLFGGRRTGRCRGRTWPRAP